MIGLVHAVARKASGAYSAHGTSTRAASAPRRSGSFDLYCTVVCTAAVSTVTVTVQYYTDRASQRAGAAAQSTLKTSQKARASRMSQSGNRHTRGRRLRTPGAGSRVGPSIIYDFKSMASPC